MCNPSSHLRPFIRSFHFISFRFVRSFVNAFLAFSRIILCACCSPWKCAEGIVPFVSTPPFHSLLFPFRFKSSLSFVTFFLSFQLLYPVRYCFPLFQIIRQIETLSSGQGVIKITSSRSLCRGEASQADASTWMFSSLQEMLLASSRCHDAAMLRLCQGLLASSRCHDAATLRRAARVASSRLGNEIFAPVVRPQCKSPWDTYAYMYLCIYVYMYSV